MHFHMSPKTNCMKPTHNHSMISRLCRRFLLVGGGELEWEFCEPNLLLAETLMQCPQLWQIYLELASRHPPSINNPWHIVTAFDEFVPGNAQGSTNWRKCMVLSFSFMEFGEEHLRTPTTWMTPIVVRSSIVRKCTGGWSRMLRDYFRVQLLGPNSIQFAGCPVVIGDMSLIIHAKLKVLMSDGDGIRIGFDWRGQSGLKPCFKHFNVWKIDSDMAGRQPGHVEITCGDATKFCAYTDADYYGSVDSAIEAKRMYNRRELTKGLFENWCKLCGLNCNEDGLPACVDLRRCFSLQETVSYDWVHTLLQDGFVSDAVFRLFEKAEKNVPGFTMRALETFLQMDCFFSGRVSVQIQTTPSCIQ